VKVPSLYLTSVSHARTAPVVNAFRHRSYHWLVDLDDLPVLPLFLRPLARFDAGLRQDLDTFLAGHGVHLDGGRILMLAHPRVLGYVFNPLSVFWCHDPAGRLACVVAEVHNTYGGRHRYLLFPDADGKVLARKEFYVSPFHPVDGHYEMRLPLPAETLDLAITLHRPQGGPFRAALRGTRRPATTAAVLRAFARTPWVTLVGAAQIRYQGIRLWLRRLPVAPRTTEPEPAPVEELL
jgi:DUF1365 family protein